MSGVGNKAFSTAKGLRAALLGTQSRIPLVLVINGQSIPSGPVLLSDKAEFPNAFMSQRVPGWRQKRVVDIANRGSCWPGVMDGLYDRGYFTDVINCAVGGSSLPIHWTGIIQQRAAGSIYYQQRLGGTTFPDLGDFGDIYAIGSRMFNITSGRKRSAYNTTPNPSPVGTSAYQDFVAFSQESLALATTAPDVSAIAIGGTLVDGQFTSVRINEGLLPYETDFKPGHDGTNPNINWNGLLGEQAAGRGYDPLGLQATTDRMIQHAHPSTLTIVIWENGQSDLGASRAGYKRYLMMWANHHLRRGRMVMIANTIYSGGSFGSTVANYEAQVGGAEDAIAELSVIYPGMVHRGPNLYNVLGRTGPMGAQRITGGVSGTTLTVSALTANSGSGLEIGQRVWNGTTLVGIITDNVNSGSIGTYQLDRSTSVATGTSLMCAGSGMYSDGIHHNGSMVSAISNAYVDALSKAKDVFGNLILPKIPLISDL